MSIKSYMLLKITKTYLGQNHKCRACLLYRLPEAKMNSKS